MDWFVRIEDNNIQDSMKRQSCGWQVCTKVRSRECLMKKVLLFKIKIKARLTWPTNEAVQTSIK